MCFVCVQVLELTKEWTNKWNETQNILKVRRALRESSSHSRCVKSAAQELTRLRLCVCAQEETLALRKEGIGVVLDSELPHLIGIDDDLLSTGIILYHLKVRLHLLHRPVDGCLSLPQCPVSCHIYFTSVFHQ